MTAPLPSRRSFATVLVLWAVAIASIMLVALQSTAWRQSAAGREAVARIRAKWAARAGIETCIATLASDTLNPDPGNALRIMDDLAGVSRGELAQATYSIRHTEYPNEVDGAEDAAAKININTMTKDDLLTFIDMDEGVADAILDWIDADDDVQGQGAESGYYQKNKAFRYAPRNAPMRTIQELELVAGVDPKLVRGEDWNLNGVLDPSEDDGDASWPPDNADGILDAGWSAYLTAYSADGGLAFSGKERLDLRTADKNEIATRASLDKDQADAIALYASRPTAKIEDFLLSDVGALARAAGGRPPATQARALTDEELASLFNECSLVDSTLPAPMGGKLNINTCTKETLGHLAGIQSSIADSIILERQARSQGFTSIIDLLDVPSITRARLATIAPYLTVRSNVFVVTSRGRDDATGLEVEITAVLDRSTLPIVLKDFLIR